MTAVFAFCCNALPAVAASPLAGFCSDGATRLVFNKTTHEAVICRSGEVAVDTVAAYGVNDEGFNDKEKRGDNVTPVGRFFVTEKDRLDNHPFLGNYWLMLSYPSPEHAAKGLQSGLISRDEYDRILRAYDGRYAPPQDTALGGYVGIHSGRDEATLEKRNWTEGCVALSDAVLSRFFDRIEIGTEVIIVNN